MYWEEYLCIRICEVTLTFELLTVRGQQHSFSTQERMFLWKCQSFWDRKCLDRGGTRTANLRIHAECSNHLSYQGQTFAVPCFEHWLWRYLLIHFINVFEAIFLSSKWVFWLYCIARYYYQHNTKLYGNDDQNTKYKSLSCLTHIIPTP